MKIISSIFVVVLFSVSISANMRAPQFHYSHASYAVSRSSEGLTVKKEDLSFECPAFQNLTENSDFMNAACDVNAVYELEAEKAGTYRFEFILPSDLETSVSMNGEASMKIKPLIIKKLNESEKEIYRAHPEMCSGPCSEKSDTALYRVSFSGTLKKGLNRISAGYRQILSHRETKYGYASSSKWASGLSYELWPLKEWKLASDFQMNVRFTVPSPGFFSSAGTVCTGEDLNFQKYPFSILKKEYSKSETGTSGMPERTKPNHFYSLKEKRKISEKDGKILYEVSFGNSFPDRISCSYGHTKEH
ncbi:MAG TPA: hypothetical protein PK453_22385 [Leptospiraceae bacterium]|nr:hypothetical protein [Leptospiraceae bacterium]HNF16427.1 hypothetical protein [Leptospiraceae bacterium]HNJ00039.1 hypothetical protein [Leptospiraceae bacterium]HNM05924.1 hypothetical protein [Leptospiraceae bacterium]